MKNKCCCIRIENLEADPFSTIFVDNKKIEYCEYPFELANALTKIITDLQNNNQEFYLECVDVEYFSVEEE